MMQDMRGVESSVEEEAAFWFARMRADDLRAIDRARFTAWHEASSDHSAAYSRYESLWESIGEAAADPSVLEMRREALARAPERSAQYWQRLTAIAATLAIFLLGGMMLVRPDPVARDGAPVELAQRGQPKIYRTAVGHRSAVTLDDGSVVELNTDSVLQVDYSPARRDVRLLRGQALFDVAHDSDRPFVVEAAGQRVTALGTAFDIRVEDGEMRVTLIEGRVEVEPVRSAAAARQPEATILDPGEQLIAAADQPFVVHPANVAQAVSWRTGRVIFSDEPLGDVVEEINRYSRHRVMLGDPTLAELRVSGVFRAGSVDSFVSAIDAAFPVAARDAGDEIVLSWE